MDGRTGDVLLDGPPYTQDRFSFMGIMLALHVDLFAGLPGELFLGFMGLLFCVAIVSGVVLYGPFMKKLEFGTVRASRSTRLKWLDLHNLLGIVTLVWAFVVGVTGVINELSTPLFRLWQSTELVRILEPYKARACPPNWPRPSSPPTRPARPCPTAKSLSSPSRATLRQPPPLHRLDARRLAADLAPEHARPGGRQDRRTDDRGAHAWYLTALELSRPLHFGDYAGMPLKIIWALLDVITIIVLVSGLYLWLARRRATEARIADLVRKHQPPPSPTGRPHEQIDPRFPVRMGLADRAGRAQRVRPDGRPARHGRLALGILGRPGPPAGGDRALLGVPA